MYITISQFVARAMILLGDLLTLAGLVGLFYFICQGFIVLGNRLFERRKP